MFIFFKEEASIWLITRENSARREEIVIIAGGREVRGRGRILETSGGRKVLREVLEESALGRRILAPSPETGSRKKGKDVDKFAGGWERAEEAEGSSCLIAHVFAVK